MIPKLILLDCDGCLCSGSKLFDNEAKVTHKAFCDKDRTAMNAAKKIGLDICFVTADKNINEAYASFCGVDFWYTREDDGTINKESHLDALRSYFNVELDEIIYLGDDWFDIEIMQRISEGGGSIFCPSDANYPVLDLFRIHVLESKGGEGCFAEIYYKFLLPFFVNI